MKIKGKIGLFLIPRASAFFPQLSLNQWSGEAVTKLRHNKQKYTVHTELYRTSNLVKVWQHTEGGGVGRGDLSVVVLATMRLEWDQRWRLRHLSNIPV